MSTLLMRLIGPMQSWGTQSRFSERDTGREPSKSGVIGLICAALGRPRQEPIDDLVALRFSVRVDQEGEMRRDYHTTQDIYKASGKGTKKSMVSNRYYLADASFLVALEGEKALLAEIDTALRNPCWQIFLGRKAFLPSLPVWVKDGLLENGTIKEAFESQFCLRTKEPEAEQVKNGQVRLRCIIETEFGQHDAIRADVPQSFVSEERAFLPRYVKHDYVELDRSLVKEVTSCFSQS